MEAVVSPAITLKWLEDLEGFVSQKKVIYTALCKQAKKEGEPSPVNGGASASTSAAASPTISMERSSSAGSLGRITKLASVDRAIMKNTAVRYFDRLNSTCDSLGILVDAMKCLVSPMNSADNTPLLLTVNEKTMMDKCKILRSFISKCLKSKDVESKRQQLLVKQAEETIDLTSSNSDPGLSNQKNPINEDYKSNMIKSRPSTKPSVSLSTKSDTKKSSQLIRPSKKSPGESSVAVSSGSAKSKRSSKSGTRSSMKKDSRVSSKETRKGHSMKDSNEDRKSHRKSEGSNRKRMKSSSKSSTDESPVVTVRRRRQSSDPASSSSASIKSARNNDAHSKSSRSSKKRDRSRSSDRSSRRTRMGRTDDSSSNSERTTDRSRRNRTSIKNGRIPGSSESSSSSKSRKRRVPPSDDSDEDGSSEQSSSEGMSKKRVKRRRVNGVAVPAAVAAKRRSSHGSNQSSPSDGNRDVGFASTASLFGAESDEDSAEEDYSVPVSNISSYGPTSGISSPSTRSRGRGRGRGRGRKRNGCSSTGRPLLQFRT